MATKPTATTIKTFEDVDAKLLEYARHQVVLKKKEAEMNAELQTIKDKYDGLTLYRREQCISIEADIQKYCDEHKKEFTKPRTMSLAHGTVGFRTKTESIVLLNKKFKWDDIVETLKGLWKKRYIRLAEVPDKELLLKQYRAKKITDSDLARAGLKVDQGDAFVLKIDWESIDA